MSLIQDALKRQQEESGNNQAAPRIALASNAGAMANAGAPAPSVPDTMPLPPGPGPQRPTAAVVQPERSGKSWKQIAGIIIFLVLVAWGGGLLVRLVLGQDAARDLLGKFMSPLAQVRATLDKTAIKTPPPPAPARTEPMVVPAPVRSTALAPVPWISPAAAAAPAIGEEQEDEAEAALPGVNKPELPAPRPDAAPVFWPRLKLSAVFSKAGSGQAGARLNNRLILLGDQIEGVTLIEIRPDSVVLKCGAETRSLKMGQTLN